VSNGDSDWAVELPYEVYLQTPHWRELRAAALKRAERRCESCWQKTRPLDVHHLTYDNLGHEHADELMVLCRKCHRDFHANAPVMAASFCGCRHHIGDHDHWHPQPCRRCSCSKFRSERDLTTAAGTEEETP
jgi:hypothetical protein